MGCARLCRSSAAVTVLVGALLARSAYADPTSAELQAARNLFVQAERDEDAGRWQQALTKLGDVARVKLTAGVRFHMALCKEELGQLTDALDDYVLAEHQSGVEGARDVLRLVSKRLEQLRARVPRLVLRVLPASPDSVLNVDGRIFSQTDADAGVPLDPGTHRIDVSARGAMPASTNVTLHEHEVTVVDLRLAPLADPVPPSTPAPLLVAAPAPVEPHRSGTGHQVAAIAATVAAVTLSAGGLAAFQLAAGAHDRGLTACAGANSRMPDACYSQRHDVRLWDFAAAGAWVGALAAGTIAVVLWAAPSVRATGVGARIGLGPGSLELKGDF
ncbi:MAG: hypothetical protein M3O50_03250 [Myxococcota bacterium]|nr:hypothetical protein [Myxococcota bacterium]